MSSAALTGPPDVTAIEKVILAGDLKDLRPSERLAYYNRVCESLGLNPLTQPFAYLVLSGKMTLYARKDAAEQLRSVREISLVIKSRELMPAAEPHIGLANIACTTMNLRDAADEYRNAIAIELNLRPSPREPCDKSRPFRGTGYLPGPRWLQSLIITRHPPSASHSVCPNPLTFKTRL